MSALADLMVRMYRAGSYRVAKMLAQHAYEWQQEARDFTPEQRRIAEELLERELRELEPALGGSARTEAPIETPRGTPGARSMGGGPGQASSARPGPGGLGQSPSPSQEAGRPVVAPETLPERPALEELDALIGLGHVKEIVKSIANYVKLVRERARRGLRDEDLMVHMVFSGNPGTGKTTVARILGRLFREIGFLERGHLVETDRAGLVGQYIGSTALKTQEKIQQALGGVLFVDEAYALVRGDSQKDFGLEAVDTLIKAMEDHRDNLTVIFAGYTHEMRRLMESNPGLPSRVRFVVEFPDYKDDELMAIFKQLLARRDYTLSPQAEPVARLAIESLDAERGNARLVRNLVEDVIMRKAGRLVHKKPEEITHEDLTTITPEDFPSTADG